MKAINLPTIAKMLVYIFLVFVALLVMVNIHEIGHTFFARLFGDNQATYYLYKPNPNGGFDCIGCNIYDENALSFWGNIFVTLGGVIFSQGLAVILLAIKNKTDRIRRFRNTLTIVCVFDVVFQVAQGVLANTKQQVRLTRGDIADFVWLVTNQTSLSPHLVKGILVIFLVVYLVWFIHKVRENHDP